jgi:hypothetical protein
VPDLRCDVYLVVPERVSKPGVVRRKELGVIRWLIGSIPRLVRRSLARRITVLIRESRLRWVCRLLT